MMFFAFVGVFFGVFGQRYPEFFDKDDLERLGFMKHRGNPNPVVKPHENTYKNYMNTNKPPLRDFDRDYENVYKYRAMYDEFDAVDDRITKYGAWDEFKDYAEKLKEEASVNPNHDWHDDMKRIIQWTKNLKWPRYQPNQEYSNGYTEFRKPGRPSPGMAGYWAENDDTQKQRKRLGIPTGSNTLITERKKMEDIILKLKELQEKPESDENIPQTLRQNVQQILPNNRTTIEKRQNYTRLPKVDDFGAPIKWVSLYSNDTRDGLAKVTDPKTNRNWELIINGSILVPVIDYSMERLGLTSTVKPILTTVSTALRSVIRSIDLKTIEAADWLIFELAQGVIKDDNQCDGDGCHARCKKLGCESMCNGDTCSSGCVSSSCNTFCRGPGCHSMCIGDGCTAKCDGLSCDARCRGVGCEAKCNSFSCHFSVNGMVRFGGGAWKDHYPQYNEANIRQDFD